MNVGINSKFTKYEINEKAEDFKDLIKIKYNKYLKYNLRRNACFLTSIINKFYDKFSKVKSDGKRVYKDDLTYEYLVKIEFERLWKAWRNPLFNKRP
jgi:hypothetical protein